jgi:hypothetical protein
VEGEEGGWRREMMTGQTNNRDRKAIRENGGKEFKTQKGKGTKKKFSSIISNGACASGNVIEDNSKCYHENLSCYDNLLPRICAVLIICKTDQYINIPTFQPPATTTRLQSFFSVHIS